MAGKKKYRTQHSDAVVRELEGVRQRLGYSQSRMAEVLGVPFRTYQKWVYAKQRPRHTSALLGRARAMLAPARANCWEVLKCGREPGGSNAQLDGPCTAAQERAANGVNSGTNGGRICWAISGTFCGAQVEGTDAMKFISCLSCDFFYQVLQEEGLANFKLLKPGQTYVQT
ncbi:helix-turn-helix domain-containing protein [Planctomycetota bacterium]